MTQANIHISERQSVINEITAAVFTGAILIVAGVLSFGMFAAMVA